ncbi:MULTISPECIES: Hint domain-containing protein [Cysteiniphilum]|nr:MULTISPECIES: Hint domain-containing protein [Cysteiniphilum]
MNKVVSVILLFILSTLVYAIDFKAPSYDKIPITSRTWQEVDLSYTDIIKGKSYPAEIKLLRPIEWLEENGMDKVRNEVNLSIPEFGVVNVKAIVTAIKPTTLDTSKIDWSKMDSRPVIGKFKRYASVVKTYTFKDIATDEINTINATPNHPFYVKNKDKFVPIDDVTSTDQLVNDRGQTVKLICDKGKSSQCGKSYNTNGKPVAVYNLEVYQRHVYFVGDYRLLVHNICEMKLKSISQGLPIDSKTELGQFNHEIVHQGGGFVGVISKHADGVSQFENFFSPDEWVMIYNNRSPSLKFHANDIIREQYLLASKEGGFVGIVPNVIVRDGIQNQITLSKLSRLESNTGEFLKTFLEETPNGKNTSYMLRDFDLIPLRAEWSGSNINVYVKPIWRPWEWL